MADQSRIIIIRCDKCKSKIFKYEKVGRGHILRCHKKQIIEDDAIYNNKKVFCQCGNEIGVDKGRYIKMNVVHNV